MDAASDEVRFVGAIYEPSEVAALRLHSAIYLHGHTVGGTNPSLVEALAVGNPVVAHDNPYNRWVAGQGALYFDDVESASSCISELLDSADLRAELSAASRARHAAEFTWEHVASQYESVLWRFVTRPDSSVVKKREWAFTGRGTRTGRDGVVPAGDELLHPDLGVARAVVSDAAAIAAATPVHEPVVRTAIERDLPAHAEREAAL